MADVTASAPRTSTVKVAVTQHEPAWLDLEAGTKKTCDIIKEAAAAGAKLVAFPECWIPGYPAWIVSLLRRLSRNRNRASATSLTDAGLLTFIHSGHDLWTSTSASNMSRTPCPSTALT